MRKQNTSLIHKTFEIGILLKGINGILELVGGVLFFIVKPQTINGLVVLLTQGELSEDPKDIIANYLLKSASQLSLSGEFFGGLFLLSHGIIKVLLIIALYKRKLWAYPLAMTVFGLFIAYQLYRFSISSSLWMIVLSLLDMVVIILTYYEYRNLKRSSQKFGEKKI